MKFGEMNFCMDFAELSDVLWKMVLRNGFAMDIGMGAQAVIIFVLLCPFAMLTVIILLIMEGLSAFLHTLRLHWYGHPSRFTQSHTQLPLHSSSIIKTN